MSKIKIIATLIIITFCLVLGFQNLEAISVYFLFFSFTVPTVALIFISLMLGIILGLLLRFKVE